MVTTVFDVTIDGPLIMVIKWLIYGSMMMVVHGCSWCMTGVRTCFGRFPTSSGPTEEVADDYPIILVETGLAHRMNLFRLAKRKDV